MGWDQRDVTVVAGVSGIVGRAVASRLIAGGGTVIGLSRTAPNPAIPGLRHVSVDLSDKDACAAALSGNASNAGAVIFAGRAPNPDPAIEADRNLAMLRNVVEGLEAAGAPLEHVHLVHGCKWYGSHLGAYPTPAEEDDPRPDVRNFYYDQQDYAVARGEAGAPWSWSALRPHVLTGFSLGYPHNLIGVLAAMGTIRRQRGQKLSFPGTEQCFFSLTQVTDLGLLVDAILWCMATPAARNEAFNVICADYFRFCDVWHDIADFFEVEPAGVKTQVLGEAMLGADGLWLDLAKSEGLIEPDLSRIANWTYGDTNFRIWWDDMASNAKIRRAGFETPDRVITSRRAILGALQAYRDARVIP
jgi:nucleoside-diphosphate-sugar epimerase